MLARLTVLGMIFLAVHGEEPNIGSELEEASSVQTRPQAFEDIQCSKLHPIENWLSKMSDNKTYPLLYLSDTENGTEEGLGEEKIRKGRRRGRGRYRKTVSLQIWKPRSGFFVSEGEYEVQILNHLSHEVQVLLVFQSSNHTCGAGFLPTLFGNEGVNRKGNCSIKSEISLNAKMSNKLIYVAPECGCVNVSVHYAYTVNNETHIVKPSQLNKLLRSICASSQESPKSIFHHRKHMRKHRRMNMRKNIGPNRRNRQKNRFGRKHRGGKFRGGNRNRLAHSKGIHFTKKTSDEEELILEKMFNEDETEWHGLNEFEEGGDYDGSGEEDSSESDESSEEESSEEESSEEDENSDESSEEDENSDESDEDENEGSGEDGSGEEESDSDEEQEEDSDEEGGKEEENEDDEDSENEEEEESEVEEEFEDNKYEEELEGSAVMEEKMSPYFGVMKERMSPYFGRKEKIHGFGKRFRNTRRKHKQRHGTDIHFKGFRFCCRQGLEHKLHLDNLIQNTNDPTKKCQEITTEVTELAKENFKMSAEFCSQVFISCCKERKPLHGHSVLSIISLMKKYRLQTRV